jgi:CHASE2 domain-containing sensor protein
MLRRLSDWVLPEDNPAGVVYGLIMIGAVMAAESGLHDTYLETAGSAVLTVGVYWLAHAYADLLGRRLAVREHLTGRALLRALAHDWAIVRGATLPLLALLVAWAAGAAQTTAVSAAVWTCAVSLVAFELLAGIRAKSTPRELVLEGCVGTVMGLSIVALRAILH